MTEATTTVPSDTVQIELAQPQDLARLAVHFAEVADEPLFVLTAEFPRTLETTEKFLAQVLASPYVGLELAKVENRVVGHCLIRSTDHPALKHVAKISMAVSKEARRKGVGELLLRAAERWAQQRRLRKIVLDVLANNRPALRLYEKLSYREEGARKDQVMIDGQFHDELLLAKFL
jgi:RimJ/RimL family protein N-acetyltransferase